MKHLMRTIIRFGAAGVLAASLASCASTPSELEEARLAYQEAQQGPAQEHAPVALREAEQALLRAEAEFEDEGDDDSTRALSYVALRKATLANVKANQQLLQVQREQRKEQLLTETERARQQASKRANKAETRADIREAELRAQKELAAMNANQLEAERKRLDEMQKELEAARTRGELTEAELLEKQAQLNEATSVLAEERARRKQLEARLKDMQARLEAIAQVERKDRQTIITLPGNLLFEYNKAVLMEKSKDKLREVVKVLKENEKGSIVVEGHTDAKGGDEFNRELSENRAQAVKAFLVSEGVNPERVVAVGKGENEPVASNDNPEGRANNRRVEIILGDIEDKEQASR